MSVMDDHVANAGRGPGGSRPTSSMTPALSVAARHVDGVPRSLDAAAALAAQPLGPEWADSIYVAGRLHAQQREFAYLVHVIVAAGVPTVTVKVTELARGRTWIQDGSVPPDRFAWDDTTLSIRTADLGWTGDLHRQELVARTPWGGLHLVLEAEGPVLYYAGTGAYAMLGRSQYHFALPRLRAAGALTVDGATVEVTGDGWLDRQIGRFSGPAARPIAFTWLGVDLPGGDQLAVWDCGFAGGTDEERETWATLLHPDGRHEIVPVPPFAQHPRRRWTSPATGVAYGAGWTLTIPTLEAELVVTVDPVDQETVRVVDGVPSAAASYHQGVATYRGTYRGSTVTGVACVDQVGLGHAV